MLNSACGGSNQNTEVEIKADKVEEGLRVEVGAETSGTAGVKMGSSKKKISRVCLLVGALVSFIACSSDPGAASPRLAVPFTSDISINEIMVAQIDHAAHFIWDAANPDLAAGEVDWEEVEHHAIQIISSRAAMTMGGTGVNDAMWVVQRSWRDYVEQMNAAGLLALSSSRAADQTQLARAGDALIATCEGCHQQYKPSIPTEGYRKRH